MFQFLFLFCYIIIVCTILGIAKYKTKRVNVRRRNIRKYRKFSELGKCTEYSVEADRLWSDTVR